MRLPKTFGGSLLEVDRYGLKEESTSIGLLNPKILDGSLLVRYVDVRTVSLQKHFGNILLKQNNAPV